MRCLYKKTPEGKSILSVLLQRKPKGYTLMELLLVVGLISIIAGISVWSYRPVVNTVTLRQIRDKASFFLTNFESCISSSGWTVDHPSGTTMYPCSNIDKIGYICPHEASECKVVKGPTDGDTDAINAVTEHICLDLGQTVKGENYQVYIVIDITNVARNKLACKELGTGAHVSLTAADCSLDSAGNLIGLAASDNKCDNETDDW